MDKALNDVELFKKAGLRASYHYACDSGAEDRLADAQVSVCFKLWHDNPELHDEMREAAKEFLFAWRL